MQRILAETSNKFNSKEYTAFTLVLGNSSCDLDSAVCPVVLAIFKRWQHERLRGRVCTRQHRTNEQLCQLFVPMLNVKRQDYELKTEVEFCFSEVGVKKDSLIFRDDVDFEELVKTSETKCILVDHHILVKEDEFLREYVTEIIDHRPRDTANWKYGEQVHADIQLVGSCSTLVCDGIRRDEAAADFFQTFPDCAQLLYGTIILDTVNFSEDIKKGTPLDLEQITFLEEVLKISDPEQHRKQTLERLKNARSDVARLSTEQLLRKDVKHCGDILVPSFPILVQEVLERGDATQTLMCECAATGSDAVVLLGVRLSQSVRRDLAVYSRDQRLLTQLVQWLKEWEQPKLELSEQTTGVSDCRFFQQGNLAASRKQVMPAIAHVNGLACRSIYKFWRNMAVISSTVLFFVSGTLYQMKSVKMSCSTANTPNT